MAFNLGGICAALSVALLMGASAGLADQTDAHITLDNPAELTKEDARAFYRNLQTRLDRGYAASRLSLIEGYQRWPLFNDAPYLSATHGNRFVNSYANDIADTYATLAPGEKLPVGSVLAKDSITVTSENRVFPGALFVMEKLPEDASPDTADWRYLMVMPDESLFGDTLGARSQAVAYCHACHEAVADRDYTFFVPDEVKVAP